MGKIQELYETRVKPMVPAERLQLARLILDDLTTSEDAIDMRKKWPDGDRGHADTAPHILSPRLAHPEQSRDFTKQVVELAADAGL